jgi:hypothetical protein
MLTCTCFILPNRCPCLMRTLRCVAYCNTMMMTAARTHASLSPLPRRCGARRAALGHPYFSVTGATEKLTEADYVAFLHQFLGFTNNPALASLANAQCPCQRYLMGGDSAWDHINCCNRHSANWSIAHEHILQALERICQAASYATSHKRMLPSEGNRRADLEVRNVHTRRSGSPQQVAGDGGVFGLIVTTSPR